MRIAVVESEPVCRALAVGALQRWGHEVATADDAEAAWTLLSAPDAPRVAVVGERLLRGGGERLLARLRAHRGGQGRAWVILRRDPGVRSALPEDADDELTTPFDPQGLRSRLQAGVRALAVYDELLAATAKLSAEARLDPLTQVASRVTVLDMLERTWAQAGRGGQRVAVVSADLDSFRRVNAVFGDEAGDAALRETATRMADRVRQADMIGRSGGQEFLVVLPGADTPGATRLAERLRAAVRDRGVVTPAGRVALTASFGVAAASATRDEGPRRLLTAAQTALAEAKSRGGDQVCAATVAARSAEVPAPLSDAGSPPPDADAAEANPRLPAGLSLPDQPVARAPMASLGTVASPPTAPSGPPPSAPPPAAPAPQPSSTRGAAAAGAPRSDSDEAAPKRPPSVKLPAIVTAKARAARAREATPAAMASPSAADRSVPRDPELP